MTTLTSEIMVMNADGSNQSCLTCGSGSIPHLSNDQPEWHPSGQWIMFQSADPTLDLPGIPPSLYNQYIQGGFGYNNNLWVMDAGGSAFYQLAQVVDGGGTLHPHFSPDGTKVLWSSYEPRRLGGDGWILKLADFTTPGGVPTLANIQILEPIGATGDQVYEAHGISNDNSTILYSYSPGQPLDLDIWKTNLNTSISTNLTNAPGVWDEHAHFSPDGSTIAWISSQGYAFTPTTNWQSTLRTDIWTMNPDGSNKQQLTTFNASGHYIVADLAWSPDGRSLVASRSSDTVQVVRVDLASSTGSGSSAAHPSVMVSAGVANSNKTLLRTGDYAFAFAQRDDPNVPITTSTTKFTHALSLLSHLSTSPAVLHKVLVVSTLDDLHTVTASIPGDVDWVAYNTEGGMTPTAELGAALTYAPQFATDVHALGKKMMYVPTHNIFDSLQTSGDLATILPTVDAVLYQAQQLLTSQSPSAFATNMRGKYQYSRSVAPNARFLLQLWIGTNGATPTQISAAFNQVFPSFDTAVVGTISDVNGTTQVLQGLQWR